MEKARRFELDTGAERATGRVRLGAAVIAGAGATWILALGPGLVGGLLAVLGALAALGWISAWRRARRRVARAEDWYLALDGRGLHMALGDEATFVAWQDVTGVEVDEERLEVALHRESAAGVSIPPIWRGAGVYDLRDIIEHHRTRAAAAAGRSAGSARG